MKAKRKILTLLLAIAMVIAMMPLAVFATDEPDPEIEKIEFVSEGDGTVPQGPGSWYTACGDDLIKITYAGTVYTYREVNPNDDFWTADKTGGPSEVSRVYCYFVNQDDWYRNIGDSVPLKVTLIINGKKYETMSSAVIKRCDGFYAEDGICYKYDENHETAYVAVASFAKGHADILSKVDMGDKVVPVRSADGIWKNRNITSVTIPETITQFKDGYIGFYPDEETGEGVRIEGFIIYGKKGSAAETYANKFDIEFRDVDAPVPAPTPTPTPAPAPTPDPTAAAEAAAEAEFNGIPDASIPAAKGVKAKAGKKSFTVSWKKASGKKAKKFDKVEIQYSLDPSFPRAATTVKIVKKTKKSLKVKKLAKKSVYYVRVRDIKYVNSAKHVSAWKVKKVKVR